MSLFPSLLALLFVSWTAQASPDGAACITKYIARAQSAGLHYVQPGGPGIQRFPIEGRDFQYFGPDGQEIKDAATLERIKSLRIPPAYHDVWISADPEAHIQAVGLSESGKTQYRYHPNWIKASSEAKFARVREFGNAIPKIRSQVNSDLLEPGLSKTKVLAALTKLLDETYIRVGNEEYAQSNSTYGLTTLLKSHLRSIDGDEITFDFVGKASKPHEAHVHDATLASILKDLQALPGDHLFEYVGNDGSIHKIASSEVNSYLAHISGGKFTAKDFRTWGGTTSAVKAFIDGSSEAQAVEYASERLGNTPEVCRENYIDPRVLAAHQDMPVFNEALARAKRMIAEGSSDLPVNELTTLLLLGAA